jgi:hypothetical protein
MKQGNKRVNKIEKTMKTDEVGYKDVMATWGWVGIEATCRNSDERRNKETKRKTRQQGCCILPLFKKRL